VTDTQGFLVGRVVQAAYFQDRDGATRVLKSIRYRYPWLRNIFANCEYAGKKLKTALVKIGKWKLQIVRRTDEAKGCKLLLRGWVVEQNFAWLGRNRRMAKGFERTIESATA
jgi:putative transposase